MSKRKKLIIHYDESFEVADLLPYLLNVIGLGRVSKGAKGKLHFCWHSGFKDGVQVWVMPKYKNDNDVFVIHKNNLLKDKKK